MKKKLLTSAAIMSIFSVG